MLAGTARTLCPDLVLAPLSSADIPAAEAALSDLSFGFADRIEREPARAFFEVGDLSHLYPAGLGSLAEALRARAARVGLEIHVAIAASKGLGRVLARVRGSTVVESGQEARLLAPLPCRALGESLDPATGETLARWGIRTLGQLASLPAEEVVLRLGPQGLALHRLARGDGHEPFFPQPPADAVEETLESEYALTELEPLAFLLRGLLDRLLARLACRSLACAGITLRLALESKGFDVRSVPLAAPTRENAPILQLVRLDLARRPPESPVVGVTVVALPARVRATQLDFLRPAGPRPDQLAATVSRLAALVGMENIGAPRLPNTWREEEIEVVPFSYEPPASPSRRTTDRAKGTTSGARTSPAAGRAAPLQAFAVQPSSASEVVTDASSAHDPCQLTIRRFRPPQEVEVIWDREGPSALRHPSWAARILVAAGPYRVEGEWWHPPSATERAPLSRDYWDVQASDGAIYRLHQERATRRWYLDGYYD